MREYFKNLFGGNNGLASNYGGVGTYATFTGTDGSKIGLNKDAYDAAIANGPVDGLSKGFDSGTGLADFLSSDSLKGVGTIAGIGSGLFNIMNSRKALKQAERAWSSMGIPVSLILTELSAHIRQDREHAAFYDRTNRQPIPSCKTRYGIDAVHMKLPPSVALQSLKTLPSVIYIQSSVRRLLLPDDYAVPSGSPHPFPAARSACTAAGKTDFTAVQPPSVLIDHTICKPPHHTVFFILAEAMYKGMAAS